MLKKNRTYTVVFMRTINGGFNNTIHQPDFFRKYKSLRKANAAIHSYFNDTGFEAFVVRGDDRDSHRKKPLTFQPLL